MLIVRFFDSLLIIAGLALVIVGLTGVSGKTEEQPTVVSITALENGQKPDAKWLKITDGEVYFRGLGRDVKTDASGNQADAMNYYLPLGSKSQVAKWMSAPTTRPAMPGCPVIVVIDHAAAKAQWPEMSKGDVPAQPAPFVCDGTVVADAADRRLRELYGKEFPDLDLSKVLVLSHGSKPLQKGNAAMLSVAGGAMVVIGVLIWRIKRHRRRHDVVPVATPVPAVGSPPNDIPPPT